MRIHILPISCALATGNALALSHVSKPQGITEPDIRTALEIRTDITVVAAAIAAGATWISNIAGLASYLAIHVKDQSDSNSCSLVSGNADGANWQFQATTSGSKCDTTSETKTIEAAVKKELNWMHNHSYDVACFKMKHGHGTWTGNLKISLDGKPIPSASDCNNAKYVQI